MFPKRDMGYTYGVQDEKPGIGFKGTYVTIWRKQKGGSWKFYRYRK
jgi:hypothetical protein